MWYDVSKLPPPPKPLNQNLLHKKLPRILVCLNISYLHCFERTQNSLASRWQPNFFLTYHFRQRFKEDFSWNFRHIIFPRSLLHDKLQIRKTRTESSENSEYRPQYKNNFKREREGNTKNERKLSEECYTLVRIGSHF